MPVYLVLLIAVVVAVYDLLLPLVGGDVEWGAALVNTALFGGPWILVGVLLRAAGRSATASGSVAAHRPLIERPALCHGIEELISGGGHIVERSHDFSDGTLVALGCPEILQLADAGAPPPSSLPHPDTASSTPDTASSNPTTADADNPPLCRHRMLLGLTRPDHAPPAMADQRTWPQTRRARRSCTHRQILISAETSWSPWPASMLRLHNPSRNAKNSSFTPRTR